MKVLVTGGAGFIGSYVVDRLLADGYDVRVLDSLDAQVHDGVPDYLDPAAELVVGDVRDRDVVRRCLDGVERVYHLAAAVGVGQSMYEIERYTSVNAGGAAVVLEAMIPVAHNLEKVVVASSMSIYGEGLYRCPLEDREVAPPPRSDDQLAARRWEPLCDRCGAELVAQPTPERKPLAPTSIYAIGKRDHEEMFRVWGRGFRVPVTAFRFFNVFGPRQALSNPYTGVVAIFASRLLNGRAPVIFEDGHQSRDFVHVRDVARAVVQGSRRGVADDAAVNVGGGRAISVLEVARTLARELDTDIEPEVRYGFRVGDIRHCVADTSRATELLGPQPRVSFEDGMREMVGWLEHRTATDQVDEATAALARHGLLR
jgi:dTDP-L-rhamnose 4-epimerase